MHHRRSTAGRPAQTWLALAAAIVPLGTLAATAQHAALSSTPPRSTRPAKPATPIDEPDSLQARVETRFGLRKCTIISVAIDAGADAGRLRLTVPIRGKACALELDRHSVRSDDFRLAAEVAGGRRVDLEPGPIRTYRGRAVDMPGSVVAATLDDDGLHAMIDLPGDGRHWLQPLAGAVADAADDQYVLYDDVDVVPSGGTCATDAQIAANAAAGTIAGTAAGPGPGECLWTADLAIDADYYYFQSYGSIAAVQTKIESVINAVNLQFERDVQITHQITGILVRTSDEDDPYSATAATALLSQFRDQWRFLPPLPVERDVTHLFTGRDLEGSTVGVAWSVGMICTTGAYCLTQSDCCTPNLACATDLSAHELGHLWGAGHCGCVDPAYTMNDYITCINRFDPIDTIPDIIAHRNSRTCLVDHCVPANDECGDAEPVGEGVWPFTTAGASTDGPAESDCFGSTNSMPQLDVWFRYDADCDGLVTVDVCDADFDTRLAAYGPSCPFGINNAIACDDDGCGNASTLGFEAVAGQSYLVRVAGTSGASGSGTLTISCATDCPTDVDGDGVTNVDDLIAVVLAWGTTDPATDVDGSGLVDVDDLLAVITGWGACP